ncbi:Cytochrome c oxidase assembly factor 7 [Blattella germanica]|nr:Cytochrome c oxidase assembly factor 7 [Blattella germanica]
MAFDLKDESQVKEYIDNLGIEYRFGCYKEKKPEVCHLLGDFFESIKKDFKKAGNIYKTNCDDYNYGRSCYRFGSYKLVGKGEQKMDLDEAYNYYSKGCELGISESCLNAGLMCIANGPHAKKVKDYEKGLQHLEKGCDANHPFCCYYIGGLYIPGLAEANIKKDMEKARKYSEKACELGNLYACINVSQMYKKGDGIPQDEKKAEKYKKRAQELQDEVAKQQQTLTFQQGASQV